jgi:hypothetical protein
MTLTTYTTGTQPSTTPTTRRRLVGTSHSGPSWTNAVRVLRAATENAVAHTPCCRHSVTADRVGTAAIDAVGELDARSLHVLLVVLSILVRASQRRQ